MIWIEKNFWVNRLKKFFLFGGILILILMLPLEVGAVGNILGVIYQKDGKTPVRGAEVVLISKERPFQQTEITGASGSFRFMNIPAGNYLFRVRAVGYREIVQEITIRIGKDTRRIDLRLEPLIPGLLKGRVFREDNLTPLSGVTIIASGPRGTLPPVLTDEEGSYQLTELIPGGYHLKARLSGFRERELTGVMIEEGKVTPEVNFYLPEIPVNLEWRDLCFWKRPAEIISLPLFLCKIHRVKLTVYRLDLFFDLAGDISWREILDWSLSPERIVREWEEEIVRPEVVDGIQHTITLSEIEKGIYLLEALGGERKSRCLLIISPLSLLVKVSPQMVMTYAFDNQEGIPLNHSPVRIYDEQGLLSQGETDEGGIYTGEIIRTGSGQGLAVVRAGEDEGVTVFGFPVSSAGEIFLYPSQRFYLLDQAVPFTGILWGKDGGVLSGKQVAVRIKDPAGKTVYQNQLISDVFGIFQDSYFPESTVSPGIYWLEAEVDNISGRISLEILPFSSSTGHIRLMGGERYFKGENVSINVELLDGKGNPLAKKAPAYKIYRRTGEGEWNFWQEGKVVTDAQGRAVITFTLPGVEKEEQFLMVTTISIEGAELKESISWKVVPGVYQLQLKGERRIYLLGEEVGFDFLITDWEGRPISTNLRIRWLREENDREIIVREEEIPPAAQGRVTLNPPQEGYYRCLLSYLDMRGSWLQEESSFLVTGENYQGKFYPVKEIEIITDRDFYLPGEKVRVLINSPVEQSYLWVTVVGKEILHCHPVFLTGTSYYWEFPISPEYFPEVCIEVHLVQREKIQYHTRMVKILVPEKRLKVYLRTDQYEFRPGERINVNLYLEDFSAKKCAGKVWLNLLGAPGLSPPTLEDSYFREIPEVKTFMYGEIMEDKDPVKVESFPIYPRSGYWEPAFWVGEGEEKVLALTTPRETGTWYLLAQAVSEKGALGKGELKITGSKKLYLEIATPPLLVTGQETVFTVILYNDWPVSQVVTLMVTGEGVEFRESSERRVVLPPKSVTRSNFKVRIVASQEVKLTARVHTLREMDEKEITIPLF